MKKLVKTAIILSIITVLLLAILNSCARIKSYDYQPVVSYESNNSQVAQIAKATNTNNSNLGLFGNILKYEQVLLVSSIVLVVIFCIIFFNLNPRKK